MFELIYTATPKGLLQGRSGFATVAMTKGFPPNLIPTIENVSGFRNLYMPGDPHVADNPVNCSYQQLRFGSSVLLVVSEIKYAGLSYTGRSNTLAHHYVFTPSDPLWTACSPASLLQCAENFPPWQGESRLLPEKMQLPSASIPQGYAAWERLTGSADWGKIIVAMVKREMAPAIVLQFSPLRHHRDELLTLMAEVSAQLTPQERVNFTFSTYCYQSAIGNPVFLRAYPENSTLLESIKYLHQEHVLILGESNAIPEKFRDLLRLPEKEIPQAPALPPKAPVPVIHPALPPEVPLPVLQPACSAVPEKPMPSARRRGWIGGIAAALLLAFAGCFALLKFYRKEKPSIPPAPVPVSAPVEKTVIAPPLPSPKPVKKAVVVPPKKTEHRIPVHAKPVERPTVTGAQRFEFFLALHSGNRATRLPDALKNGNLKQVVLKTKRASDDQITDVFQASGTPVTIYAVKTDESDPIDPKILPDLTKVELTIQVANGKLIVDPPEKIDEIKALTFAVGDFQIPFANEFEESFWAVAIPRTRIHAEWKKDKLYLHAEYAGSPFMERKIQSSLLWQVTTDAGSFHLPITPGEITIPQLTQLEVLLQMRKKVRDAGHRIQTVDPVSQPELFSPELKSLLKKYYSREERKALVEAMQEKKRTVDELEKEICKQIYQKKEGPLEKDWKPDQDKARECIGKYRKDWMKYVDHQKKMSKLENELQDAQKKLLSAEQEFAKFPWCEAVLRNFRNIEDNDGDLRKAIILQYRKATQIKLVRKTEI